MKKLPGITSFKRAIVITDATMHNVFSNDENTPVEVVRHTIMGTQNIPNDKEKERSVYNPQETDTAKLHPDASHLRVRFALRFLPLSQSLNVCTDNDKEKDLSLEFKNNLNDFIGRASDSAGLRDVALRYARNIANGRWLWRNRTVASHIKVGVAVDDLNLSFSALDIPLNNFDHYTDDEKKLGEKIMRALGGVDSVKLEIFADVDLGFRGAVEVFPSENYLSSKPKGFSRSLYKHNITTETNEKDNNCVGFAAIRDQKIGNALRTIDTWYPDASAQEGLPIAVEPNGANLAQNKFFRKNSTSAFNIFLNLGHVDPNTDEGKFSLAILMRGGVFSGGNELKNNKTQKSIDSKITEEA